MGIYTLFFIGGLLILLVIFLFLLTILVIIYGFGQYNKNKINEQKVKNILCLGARVGSPNFNLRLKYAAELARDKQLIFTGTQKECDAATEYFNEVASHLNISIDNMARNTWDNIANNHKYISENTVVVTNDFHVFRTRLICRKQHLKPQIYNNDDRIYFKSYIREIFAVLKYFSIQLIKQFK